jgi:hypothetical protein
MTTQLNEWRNDTLESLDLEDQSLWKMTRRVMRIPTPSPPMVITGGLALSDSEKAEALAEFGSSISADERSFRRG